VEVQSSIFTNGQRLALAPCSPSSSQMFKSGEAPNNNRIEVVNTAAGKFCLDVYAGYTAAGTTVTLYSCGTGNNQKWAVDTAGRLTPRNAPTMCLDSETGTVAAGSRLVINPCSNAPSQKFVAAAAGESQLTPCIHVMSRHWVQHSA
jgi:hypothetical protein